MPCCNRLRATSLVVLVMVIGAGAAEAGPILVYGTGVGDGGLPLPGGTVDPHYALSSSPYGAGPAYVATEFRPTYAPNDAQSRWIGPAPNLNADFAGGVYDYVTTFSLDGLDPLTAMLSGAWATDNNAMILLNGVDTGLTSPFDGFKSLTPFTITSGFVSGMNTLVFRVVEEGDSPTALRVRLTGTAGTAPDAGPDAPEPGTLGLLTAGAVGLFGGWYRNRRKATAA